jgi:RNA methyltransferase, TrmH family
VKAITSAGNPRYKALRRLVESSQARRRSGRSVLDGVHLTAAYLEQAGVPEHVVVSRSGLEQTEVGALLDRMPGADTLVLEDALFRTLSSVVTPTGILSIVMIPQPRLVVRDIDVCVMLEDLQDPGNLGSILRSCAAAGVRHVLLSDGSVHAWSPRVLRAAMGAHFMTRVYERVDLLAAAREFGGRVVAMSQHAHCTLFDLELGGKAAFAFGNEGAGLSRGLLEAAHAVAAIPMPGRTESLNVAAAAAVCLFERVRQVRAASRA